MNNLRSTKRLLKLPGTYSLPRMMSKTAKCKTVIIKSAHLQQWTCTDEKSHVMLLFCYSVYN